MGILQGRPKLEAGEQLRWKALANRVLEGGITSGGRLFVTDRRVFFQPNRYDAALGRKIWECRLDAVTGIETVGRSANVFAGGTRKRLGLQHKEDELRRLLPTAGR